MKLCVYVHVSTQIRLVHKQSVIHLNRNVPLPAMAEDMTPTGGDTKQMKGSRNENTPLLSLQHEQGATNAVVPCSHQPIPLSPGLFSMEERMNILSFAAYAHCITIVLYQTSRISSNPSILSNSSFQERINRSHVDANIFNFLGTGLSCSSSNSSAEIPLNLVPNMSL